MWGEVGEGGHTILWESLLISLAHCQADTTVQMSPSLVQGIS